MKRLLKEGTTNSRLSPDIYYYVYEDDDGRVFVSTLCNRYYVIAKDIDEYNQISAERLEELVYCAEMSVAR